MDVVIEEIILQTIIVDGSGDRLQASFQTVLSGLLMESSLIWQIISARLLRNYVLYQPFHLRENKMKDILFLVRLAASSRTVVGKGIAEMTWSCWCCCKTELVKAEWLHQ